MSLPYDIYTIIFNYLDDINLLKCRMVCQLWKDYIRETTYRSPINIHRQGHSEWLKKVLKCVRPKHLKFYCDELEDTFKEKLIKKEIQFSVSGPVGSKGEEGCLGCYGGGGLLGLVAFGAQDVYLTTNPQVTFFSATYQRHTNFTLDSMEISHQSIDKIETYQEKEIKRINKKIDKGYYHKRDEYYRRGGITYRRSSYKSNYR